MSSFTTLPKVPASFDHILDVIEQRLQYHPSFSDESDDSSLDESDPDDILKDPYFLRKTFEHSLTELKHRYSSQDPDDPSIRPHVHITL